MTTYYKPTERRGKRVVYRSQDPAEPKSEILKVIPVLLAIIVLAAYSWFFPR
jgi:hypothetical protein